MKPGSIAQVLALVAAVAIGIAVYSLPLTGLGPAGRATLAIVAMGAFLWVTEAIPLYATALLLIALEVILLGRPSGSLAMGPGEYRIFLEPLFDPVVVLLLGGFVLARAINQYRLADAVARLLMIRVGDNPRTILLAVMGTTALFSMWISNTATTALMLSVVLPISELIPSDDPYRKALLLGVPFAANIGGMATPIGTPPNALAIGRLGEIGISISFPLWMVLSLPIMLALLVITWRILLHAFPPTISHVVYTCEPPARPTLEQKAIGAIFGVTVLLWLTTGVHGIPSAVVALIPTVILLGSGLVAKEDLRGLGWEILILVGAGLSLGVAIDRSGLGAWVVTALHMDIMPIVFASVMFVVLTLIMTTFMSNTATASLLIPIAMGIGRTTGSLAVSIAVTSSVAMALPVSTAPNAIAYSSGILRVWDMVRVGTIVSLIAIVLILGPGLLYWRLFSILR